MVKCPFLGLGSRDWRHIWKGSFLKVRGNPSLSQLLETKKERTLTQDLTFSFRTGGSLAKWEQEWVCGQSRHGNTAILHTSVHGPPAEEKDCARLSCSYVVPVGAERESFPPGACRPLLGGLVRGGWAGLQPSNTPQPATFRHNLWNILVVRNSVSSHSTHIRKMIINNMQIFNLFQEHGWHLEVKFQMR